MVRHAIRTGGDFGFNGIGDVVPAQAAERSVGNGLDAAAVIINERVHRVAIKEIKVKLRGAFRERIDVIRGVGVVIARAQAEADPAVHGTVAGDVLVAGPGGAPLQLERIRAERIGKTAISGHLIDAVRTVRKGSPDAGVIRAQNIGDGSDDKGGIIGGGDIGAAEIRAIGGDHPRGETKTLIGTIGPVGGYAIIGSIIVGDELRRGGTRQHDRSRGNGAERQKRFQR